MKLHKTVKLRHNPDLHIEATIQGESGKPMVVIDSDADLVEDIDLGPDEAEKLGVALIQAANAARAWEEFLRKGEPPADRIALALDVLDSSTFTMNQNKGVIDALEVVIDAARARITSLRKHTREGT